MQLKHYNRLMTRTIQRPRRGETSNEVTALRFSADPGGRQRVSASVATDRQLAKGGDIARKRETTSRSCSSLLFPFLSLSFLLSKLPGSIFASPRELQPVREPEPRWRKGRGLLNVPFARKRGKKQAGPYVSLKTASSGPAVASRNAFAGAYALDTRYAPEIIRSRTFVDPLPLRFLLPPSTPSFSLSSHGEYSILGFVFSLIDTQNRHPSPWIRKSTFQLTLDSSSVDLFTCWMHILYIFFDMFRCKAKH